MALDSISQLGQTIGSLSNNQSEIKQSLTPDEANPQFNFGFSDKAKVNGSVTLSSLTYATDAFILDHPVQGYLGVLNTYVPVVSYYPLEGNVNDYYSVVNGTTTGSYTSGKINQGINLTSTQNITLGTANQYTSSAISLTFWLKPNFDASLPVATFFTLGNISLGFDDVGGLGIKFKINTTRSVISLSSGVWYLIEIFATESGTNGYIKINGTKTTNTGSASFLTSNPVFTKYDLGNTIDEIYVNDTALTDDEYNAIYNSGNGLLPEYFGYKLDEGYQGAAPKFPLTFPVKFITPNKTLLYTYNY